MLNSWVTYETRTIRPKTHFYYFKIGKVNYTVRMNYGHHHKEIEFGPSLMSDSLRQLINWQKRCKLNLKQTLLFWGTIKTIVTEYIKKYKPDELKFNHRVLTIGLDKFYNKVIPIYAKEVKYRYKTTKDGYWRLIKPIKRKKKLKKLSGGFNSMGVAS